MEKLQNNFTTPEQSKRLLELGLPADSADCFICANPIGQDTGILDFPYSEVEKEGFFPCWSVGRLMEIAAICFDIEFIRLNNIYFIQQMMSKFEMYAENMDFSKLEE